MNCTHNLEHGWDGIDGTHCRACHRTWTGAFDMHQVGDTCRDPATIPRLKPVERWGGVVWVQEYPSEVVALASESLAL